MALTSRDPGQGLLLHYNLDGYVFSFLSNHLAF
jgi:hypothetical protein